MNYVIIDGTAYDVCVDAINEYANVMDTDNAGRAIERGRMIRDIIGTAIGHKVKFSRKADDAESIQAFDALWTYLTQPRESVYVQIADGQSTISYEAYSTTFSRDVERIEHGKTFWKELEVNFIPMECQILPADIT